MGLQLRTEASDIFNVHPQLRSIGPEPYVSEAAAASFADRETQQVMLIEFDGTVIGCTGYFVQDHDPDNLYLRWHGVVPALRGHGLAHAALKLLVAYLQQTEPQRRHLIELAPVNAYGDSVAGFFRSIGFVRQRKPVQYCDEAWWPWWLDLHALPERFRGIARPVRTIRTVVPGTSSGTNDDR